VSRTLTRLGLGDYPFWGAFKDVLRGGSQRESLLTLLATRGALRQPAEGSQECLHRQFGRAP